jgi:Fur family ferric uptake transcriptional regulator
MPASSPTDGATPPCGPPLDVMRGGSEGTSSGADARAWRLGGNEALLRRHGLHVTAQRLAVMDAVSVRPHGTADELEVIVRGAIGAISRKAVYEVLATLTDKGLLRRVRPAGSPARYEQRVGDHHHHVICRACGRIADVDVAAGTAPCLTPSDPAGFEISEAEVLFWGRCPACLASATASTTDAQVGHDVDHDRQPAQRPHRPGSRGALPPPASTDTGART